MRLIRPYQSTDEKVLEEMLRVEGVPDSEMDFRNWATSVFEEDRNILGFFTIKWDCSFPSLKHFCVVREKRSPSVARLLAKAFKLVVREMGSNAAIVHCDHDYLCRIIEYYFKAKPYNKTNNRSWYLVKV